VDALKLPNQALSIFAESLKMWSGVVVVEDNAFSIDQFRFTSIARFNRISC